MISIRRARTADAVAIGAVHVATWRSAYAGILPDRFLSRMSVPRQAAHYDAAIRASAAVFVAAASGTDVPSGSGSRIVGFATAGRARGGEFARRLAEGEVETLYVLDDWRERGVCSRTGSSDRRRSPRWGWRRRRWRTGRTPRDRHRAAAGRRADVGSSAADAAAAIPTIVA